MIFPLADASLAIRDLVSTVIWFASITLLAYVLIDLARNFVRDLPPIFLQIHDGLRRIWEPILAPIRNALPALGGIDFSPLIVLLLLQLIRDLLV